MCYGCRNVLPIHLEHYLKKSITVYWRLLNLCGQRPLPPENWIPNIFNRNGF